MRASLLLLLLSLCTATIHAQVVTTSPAIFTDAGGVVVTFDASKGTGGLKDFTGDIYAHTGVITSQSSGDGDWKYVVADWGVNLPKAKLTRLSANSYTLTISPSVRQFYGVPPSETIQKLAFVFRSADGSKEGKDDGGKDVFITVSQAGLSVKVVRPLPNQILAPGDSIPFEVSARDHDSLTVWVNNQWLATDTASTLTASYIPAQAGLYAIRVTAWGQGTSITDSLAVYVRGDSPEAPLPAGARKGISILSDSSARLVLFAPGKQFVFVLADFNQWQLSSHYQMLRDSNYFWLDIHGLDPQQEYAFQYYIDGSLYIADPYSSKILDPWNDKNIPAATYPALKPYPADKGNGIVSVLSTRPDGYLWTNTAFVTPNPANLTVYELLIRDFTEGPEGKEGTIAGALSKLDYLDSLGVNAMELMPFNEFEGNDSWGYNPSFYFATDKAYGTAADYKMLIDSLHGRGMAVIMDVVLNHSYGQSPFVQMYFANGAPAANNPWYNVASPNPVYSWGYDFNHRSPYTEELVDSVLRYWVSEFKVDGFRFDFTKGFTNQPGDGWAFDGTRIGILKRMAGRIRARKPDVLLILEHLTENREEQILADDGFLLWGNMNHAYNEATMGYTENRKSDFSAISYQWRDFRKPGLVGYMESHDEERLMYKNIQYGNALADYSVKDTATGLARNALATAFFLTIPGPKMIWQFGELGYDFSIDFNGRVGRKPIRWDYAADTHRRKLLDVYRYLSHLRSSQAIFTTDSFTLDVADALKTIRLALADSHLIVVGNFGMEDASTQLTLPASGEWYELISGKAMWFPSAEVTIGLRRGEFKLFSNKPMPAFNTFSDSVVRTTSGIRVFPNPSDSFIVFDIPAEGPVEFSLAVYDFQGRLLAQPYSRLRLSGPVQVVWEADGWLPQRGVYLAKVTIGGRHETFRIVRG